MRHEDRIKARLMPRIESWRRAFSDKTTGIHRTLDDLLWQYACFRTVLRIANQKRDPSRPPFNQMIFEMIADGYCSRLLLGARRLLDPQAISGKVGVYSLRSVLADIKACAPKITRRIYVEAIWDAEFDLDRLETAHWEELREAAKVSKAIWGDPALLKSRMAHAHFDYLSGTAPENRSATDTLDSIILDKLASRLEKLDDIRDHVGSHIAHAGNVESREGKILDDFGIPEARNCLKELKQTADLIGMWFAGASVAGLATYIGDQFEGLDKPLIDSDKMPDLESAWREIELDIDTWSLDPKDL